MYLHVWDTAGSDTYTSIIQFYYRGIDAALLAIDMQRASMCDEWDKIEAYVAKTVDDIRNHKNDGKKRLFGIPDYTVPILLIMTKSDAVTSDLARQRVSKLSQKLV